ncbi:hypothetical protein MLD38_003153 [Melastoma candidum]|uniref:Uncharacterized protein n=1 Tax=Melastoma candidum TaxID=119954 RepID=A0ACB9S1F4_9MYRT|nr:hypothetical protein MLD38_003153 [Melastoma candidum]
MVLCFDGVSNRPTFPPGSVEPNVATFLRFWDEGSYERIGHVLQREKSRKSRQKSPSRRWLKKKAVNCRLQSNTWDKHRLVGSRSKPKAGYIGKKRLSKELRTYLRLPGPGNHALSSY